MVVKDLIKIIQNDFIYDEKILSKLDDFLKTNPSSSTASIARLTILKKLDHPRFKKELSKCALIVQCRKKLFEILNKINHHSSQTKKFDEEFSFLQWIEKVNEKESEINFYSPTKKATESLIEKDEFITETLAKIYMEQGHKEKAIYAFKKLILKFPEKSTLFANQINKLK